MSRAGTIVLSLGLLASAAGGQEIPPGYEIVRLTETPWRESSADINNNGQIPYTAWLGPTLESQDLFLHDSRTGETVQITEDSVLDVLPAINNQGAVVWMRAPVPGVLSDIMMRTPDGVVTTFFSDGGYNSAPRINDKGQIVWERANLTGCGRNGRAVMFYDGQSVRTIVDNEWYNQQLQLNNCGDIVWTEMDICPGGQNWRGVIKLYTDGQIMTLSQPAWQSQSCDINDDRTVVWASYDPIARRRAIYVWRDGQSEQLNDWGRHPRINNRADIVFNAWDNSRQVWDLWLQRPDRLYQLTKNSRSHADPSINDCGELVWHVGYYDPGYTTDLRFLRRSGLGDLNCDGAVDAFDIEAFVIALLDPNEYTATYPHCDRLLADINRDEVVDAFDIEPFVHLLSP